MNQWFDLGILMAAIGLMIYLLYCKGLGVIKSITAVLFVFCPGRDGDKVTLGSCTGRVRHVGVFRESKRYEFTLEAQLSEGNAEVVLLDKKKQPLLKLDRQTPGGSIELDSKKRYYLSWNFQHATGRCELHW